MLQGWSLLAAIAGGAYLLSKAPVADGKRPGLIHPLPVVYPGGRPGGPPVRDPGAVIDPGRTDPGQIMPPLPDRIGPRPPVFLGPPVPAPVRTIPPASVPWWIRGAPPVAPVVGPAPVQGRPADPSVGMFPVRPIIYNPASDPNNAAHPTSVAMLPRPVDPLSAAAAAAANANAGRLVRTPDTAGPPSLGVGWAPTASGRGAMPWDATHVPVVQAIAPTPAPPPSLTLPSPSLAPGDDGVGRHIPPPPPVAADPTGPTRTTLLPWDHPIAGPRHPELTGTRVPITDAPGNAWYGTPAVAPGVLSSAAGRDPGVTKVPTILQTIAQLVAAPVRGTVATSPLAQPVGGTIPRAGAPW